MWNSLYFTGKDWCVSADQLCPKFYVDLIDCGKPGDAEEAVRYVLSHYDVDGDPTYCRQYLRVMGAWDDEELADHGENVKRLVWLTGGSLYEGQEAHFSSY